MPNIANAMLMKPLTFATPKVISGRTLDSIILKGIRYINERGEQFQARAGSGLQSYDVTYLLLDSCNRLHNLRKPIAIKYFCRELIAYCNGSLKVADGLLQASRFWGKLADQSGNINSNYGFYIFHQKLPRFQDKTQYEWVRENLLKSLDSRRAFINVNQPIHKDFATKDFPCTLGMQIFIRQNHLCNVVSARSTDIYTGLPYDMGFFSFLTELLYKDLQERLPLKQAWQLKLGYTSVKSNFTQIYDQTKDKALELIEGLTCEEDAEKLADAEQSIQTPEIENAEMLLQDIYNKSKKTKFMQWVYDNAEFE